MLSVLPESYEVTRLPYGPKGVLEVGLTRSSSSVTWFPGSYGEEDRYANEDGAAQ